MQTKLSNQRVGKVQIPRWPLLEIKKKTPILQPEVEKQ